MNGLQAAEQAALSHIGRGHGPIGSSSPSRFISPLLQAINNIQIGSPTAQQKSPPLEFTPNPITGHGGYGTFVMNGAGMVIYALGNSHAAVQAFEPGETLIDGSTVAAIDGAPQVATITIHGPGKVDPADVDSLASGPFAQDSHSPLAFRPLGHDSDTGEGNAGGLAMVADSDAMNSRRENRKLVKDLPPRMVFFAFRSGSAWRKGLAGGEPARAHMYRASSLIVEE